MSTLIKGLIAVGPFVLAFVLLRACHGDAAQDWLAEVREIDPSLRVVVDTEDVLVLAANAQAGERLGGQALQFRQGLVREYRDLVGPGSGRRPVVVVFSDRARMQKFGRSRPNEVFFAEAFYDPMKAAVFLHGGVDDYTVRHETTHLVVAESRPRAPQLSPWLSEGLAEFLATWQPGKGPPSARDRLHYDKIVASLAKDPFDLDRLLGLREYAEFSTVEPTRNYRDAKLLTAFLFERSRETLAQLVEAEQTGREDRLRVFQNLFRHREPEFRSDLNRWLAAYVEGY